MTILDEQIVQVKAEIRRLVQRLRREEPKSGRLPHDPAFDPWRVRRRRDRYLRMMRGVVVPPGSPLVAEVRPEDIPPSGYASMEDAAADAEEATRDG